MPLVPTEAESWLADHPVNAESIAEAACLASEACSPIDDVRGGARYRKQMVRNLLVKALTEIWKKLDKA